MPYYNYQTKFMASVTFWGLNASPFEATEWERETHHRRADADVYNRDVIDLAMLGLSKKYWTNGYAKAESAYGEAVKRVVLKAVDTPKNHPDRLAACFDCLAQQLLPLPMHGGQCHYGYALAPQG